MRGRCAGLPCVEEASESAGGGAVNGAWAVTAGSCGAVLSLKSTASGTKRPSCRRGNLFSITASQLHQPARRRAAPGPGMDAHTAVLADSEWAATAAAAAAAVNCWPG